MSKRTDCHRPGAIVPNDYEYVMSYLTPGSEPFDQYGMADARQLCESIGWGKGSAKMWGHMGKCGVCGAIFRAGDIWQHTPTGDLLHVGHDCAEKYELLANNPAFDAAVASIEQRRQALKEAGRRERVMRAFLDATPGLEAALALREQHHILADMKSKLRQYGGLSEKQVAFALKLAAEIVDKRDNPQPAEKLVPAPISEKRQTIRGKVVSKKSYDTVYGVTTKITVKVETPEGNWLCWGTVVEVGGNYAQRGDTIEFDAKLSAGREPHFALFKRPTKGRVITPASDPSEDNETLWGETHSAF